MVSRNPFRVRASEYLEDESDFLSLFGLGALDVFKSEDMWTKIQIIRSARGGGKTSILRIFRPKSLNEIFDSRYNNTMKPMYTKLKNLDAFDEKEGTKILGIPLSLFGNYPVLNQLGFDEPKRMKLFYALITSRIFLATLRSVLELKKLEFPDHLKEIKINSPSEPNIPTSIPIPCRGDELYDWASKIEQRVSNIMEEDGIDDKDLGGYESLAALNIIKSTNILYNDKPVAERTLLMLDDVDKLASEQRRHLSNTLVNLRIPIGIWLAERLEALRREELLSPTGTWGREYGSPIFLEKFWRDNQKKLETLLSDIADKRASWHRAYMISSFDHNLDNFLEEKWDVNFQKAITEQKDKLISKYGEKKEFRFLFDMCENPEGDLNNTAVMWRLLEIFIEREIRKKQTRLFTDETISQDDFNTIISGTEKSVAPYYVCNLYEIPYYFSFSNLVKLASSNIQQFLDLASELFDEMISARSLEKTPRISAHRQQEILEKSATRRWDEINQTIPNSRYTVPFLNTLAKFCNIETNLPNAPYGSVTGIAISSRDAARLQDEKVLAGNPRYKILSEVITTCLAHNLLEPLPYSKQGQKGNTHLIMYLNRLLCFRYKLPLHYGGWREQSLDTLCSFIENTYKSNRKEYVDLGKQRIIKMEDEHNG